MRAFAAAMLAAISVGCSETPPPADAGPTDSGSGGDGDAGAADAGTDAGEGGGDGGSPGIGLSANHPGDVGIENEPDVVWTENFEEGSIAAVTNRYNDSKNPAGMSLLPDVPVKSSGQKSMAFTASGTGANATDLYKNLGTGYDELYLRYYAKYQGGAVQWHHTGVWVGGYNPPSNWPNPQAGSKPTGSDRFSVSFEPVASGPNARMDFYNYWMQMHSWMASPSGSTAYYGNTLIHQPAVKFADDAWMCIELHVKLNPNVSSGAGAELGLWINDVLVQHFTDTAPLGYWVRDKFCPASATGAECTDYPPPSGTPMIPLDLRWRSVPALKLNAFWPQNYITAGGPGTVQYDDMVLAKSRIGCLR